MVASLLPALVADPRSGHGRTLTSDATHRMMLITTRDSGMVIAQQLLSDGPSTWTTYTVTGAVATAMKHPVYFDDHCWSSGAYDTLGKAHVFGNMHGGNQNGDGHAGDLGYIKMATAHDVTSFTAGTLDTTGLVNPTEISYPHLLSYSDGTLVIALRSGVSGSGSWYTWRLDPGASTWVLQGMLFSGWEVAGITATSYSMYPSFYVDANDRTHVAGCWRNNVIGLDDECWFQWYGYSDDKFATMKSVEGTTISVPSAATDLPGRTLLVAPGGTDENGGWQNGGGVFVDANGRPGFTMNYLQSGSSRRIIQWNGSAWTNTNTFFTAFTTQSTHMPLLLNGERWDLSGSAFRNDVTGDASRCGMHNLDTGQVVWFGQGPQNWNDGQGYNFYPSRWDTGWPDPVALRNRGVVEVALPHGPNGATPRFFRWPSGVAT